MELTGGAQACNVFWQVGSSATFGSGTDFVGTVMALTSISAEDGATFEGRLLARNGEVTLINDTITNPGCEQADDGDDADGTGAGAGAGGDDSDTTGGDTDGSPDADGTDATGDDSSDSAPSSGSTPDASSFASAADGGAGPALPETGGAPLWPLIAGASAVGAGTVMLRRRRYHPTHAVSARTTDGED